MKLTPTARLLTLADDIESNRVPLPQDLIERLHRLIRFTEYSLNHEPDELVAERFIEVAERVVLMAKRKHVASYSNARRIPM